MSQFSNKCSKCGHLPKTRNGTAGKCPSCGINWCLIGVCPFETDTAEGLTRHQSMIHWYF